MPAPGKIFMLGFMGSGKTTLGKKLAIKLSCPFVDMDDQIEKAEGMSIATIFEQKGEPHFRKLERACLENIIENYPSGVVSTGGGAPCFFDNMALMNQHGISIYLQLTPAVILERIRNATGHRPLLEAQSDKELIDFITQKLEERAPYYLQAKHHVTHTNPQVEDVLDKLGVRR